MFGNTRDDLSATLDMMHVRAMREANFCDDDAVRLVARYISRDERFQHHDPYALARRVFLHKQNGAVLEL
jgi:hypothetical protein